MKSHTGATMSLGKGSVYSTSVRQKLNTKSSTEAELVGVDDVMPQIIWTRYFLEAQGYGVRESKIYQDNQSAMLVEKN
jgi:ribosomal protein S24E